MCYEMQCIQVFDGDAGDGGEIAYEKNWRWRAN